MMIASPAVAQQFQLSDPRQAVQNRLSNNRFGSHSHQQQFRQAGYQEPSGSATRGATPTVPDLPLNQSEVTAFPQATQQASEFSQAQVTTFPETTSPRSFSSSSNSSGTIIEMPESMSEEIGLEDLVAMQVAAIQKEDQSAYVAEFDGGFKIKPRDKEKNPFELKINGRLQFRWAAFQRDSETFTNRLGTIGVPTRNDFEIERGRLEFKGFILDPKIKYYFNLDADTDDNHQVIFHDFWFDRVINDNLTVRLGKAKVPSSYEWLESSTTTRFADRSVATTYFRADRSVGVWFLGETPNESYYQIGVTNGFVTTDLEPEDVDNNFAYSALTYRDFGSDFGSGHSDLKYHTSPSIRIGSSFSYTNTNAIDGLPTAEQNFARVSDGARLTDTGALAPGLTINDFDQYALSGFMSGKWRGFSFNAEYYARWLQNFDTVEGPIPGINDLFDSGFYVDAGYFVVPEKFEINGRISQIDGLFGDSWEYAAGWNYFLNGTHKNKLSFDATILDGIPTSSSSPNFELGQDGILYRLQYQIAF